MRDASAGWVASAVDEALPPPGPRLRDLRRRAVSALLLGPPVLFAIWVGDTPFAVLIALIGGVGFLEWTTITETRRPRWLWWTCAAGLLLAMFLMLEGMIVHAAVAVVAPLAVVLAARGMSDRRGWLAAGALYVALPTAAALLLRGSDADGRAALLFIVLLVWASDIGAYLGGRAIGGPKLWPRVSPKKTWSGAISGFAAAILVGIAVALWLSGASFLLAAFVAGLLSIASQAGDLLESALKRRFGADDSGKLIPGHGGILDRVDGLFAALVAAYLLSVMGFGAELGFGVE